MSERAKRASEAKRFCFEYGVEISLSVGSLARGIARERMDGFGKFFLFERASRVLGLGNFF